MNVRAQSYETVPIDTVFPHPDNPRNGNVTAISSSIAANGFYGALVVQRSTGYILAGNHRWVAARESGITELPVLFVDVDDDRARRILLVDNRSNDLASYDNAELVTLLQSLAQTPDALAGTCFTEAELAALIGSEFEPDDSPQPQLDARKCVTCPECGHEFEPRYDG